MKGGKEMKFYTFLALILVLIIATSAFGLERKAWQMKDDFGTAQLYDGALNYYYYIPCPTYSWFWAYSGWAQGDIVGVYFSIGDQGTGGYDVLDPVNCQQLEQVRILDFAGYGTVYPGLFTIEMDVWCPPCPLSWLGGTGPIETHYGWNYIPLDVSVCDCFDGVDLTFAVTMKMVGTDATYPAVGMDNVSTAIEQACDLHDYGCLPLVYPRAYVHSGYFGNGDPCQYDPPLWFLDGRDTTPDGSMFGPIELAWRVYMVCSGPTATEPSTWSNIKRIYR
jgi:hypothetical protein